MTRTGSRFSVRSSKPSNRTKARSRGKVSIKLYSYWRSSAAYRVRIALNLKGLEHEIVPVSLAPGVSEHRSESYRAKNPQMLIPFFEDDNVKVSQSMAI